MLNNDKHCLPVDQPLTESDQPIESLETTVETITVTFDNPSQPDSKSTTKRHRKTVSLDSLGGGWLP